MIGIMILDTVRQLIPEQIPYIFIHDFEPFRMRLIFCFHLKTRFLSVLKSPMYIGTSSFMTGIWMIIHTGIVNGNATFI
jgi:hypothetical protein